MRIERGRNMKENKKNEPNQKSKCIVLMVVSILILLLLVNLIIRNQGGIKETTKTEYLFNLKNPYIGDNSKDMKLLQSLEVSELGKFTIELKTNDRPYILRIYFDEIKVSIEEYERKIMLYSKILLVLIENADEVSWIIKDVRNDSITVDSLEIEYENLKDYNKTRDSFHSFLVNIGYFDSEMQ